MFRISIMKKLCTWSIYLVLIGGFWFAVRSQRPAAPAAEVSSGSPSASTSGLPSKHKVTSAMLSTTERAEGRSAIPFEAPDAQGRLRSLHDLAVARPLVMVFIKNGCPCSSAAQTFLNRLYDQYGSVCRFVGVIDGGADEAKAWGEANHVTFPILQDPDLAIVHRYEVENSAYVALIAPGGRIEKMWPGYSGEMLRELGHRIARTTQHPERLFAVNDAPSELYSGCPY
jgi:peroxiredoxin